MPKIYTKTGDTGITALGTGDRVAKDSLRIEAYGTVDELNSLIGVLLADGLHERNHKLLEKVQHDLFVIGGDLAFPQATEKVPLLAQERIQEMEREIDSLQTELPPLRHFILPGGSQCAANLHLARAVCRRTERIVVSLSHQVEIHTEVIAYLNRLSDLLFVMARFQNQQENHPEKIWKPAR